MKILAIETSTRMGSVALWSEDRVLATRSGGVDARHGETLLPLVQAVLEEAGAPTPDALAVGIGPGSFTGTRIGVAVAKGLALAHRLPLVGVSSLRAIAHGARAEHDFERLLVASDAGRGMTFAALFDGELALIEGPSELSPDAALALAEGASISGDGLRGRDGVELLDEALDRPRAESVAALAAPRLAAGEDQLAELEPEYVRPSDAKLPDTPLAVP